MNNPADLERLDALEIRRLELEARIQALNQDIEATRAKIKMQIATLNAELTHVTQEIDVLRERHFPRLSIG